MKPIQTMLEEFNEQATKIDRVKLVLLLVQPSKPFLSDTRSKNALATAKAYIAGKASDNEMARANTAAWDVVQAHGAANSSVEASRAAWNMVVLTGCLHRYAFCAYTKGISTQNENLIRAYLKTQGLE